VNPPLKEGRTVGIDLGTTSSAIACLDGRGNPVLIPNEDDEPRTPSVVVMAEGARALVGLHPARAALEDDLQRVVPPIKRRLSDGSQEWTVDGRALTAEFLTAVLLKQLRRDAQKRIGKLAGAVLTVPYQFDNAQRQAMCDAARIAGIHVIDLLNQPMAAALAYAWHRKELGAAGEGESQPRTMLVFSLGGGTFDVTLLRCTPTRLQVLATAGDARLGGADWDNCLVEHVLKEAQTRHHVDLRQSPAVLAMLRNDCEMAKIELSERAEATITCRHAGKTFSTVVTRSQFEKITADLLKRTAEAAESVLREAKIDAQNLDAVLLAGGATLMPQVAAMLKGLTGREPETGVSPLTAVAEGAAIYAAILDAKTRGEASKLPQEICQRLAGVKVRNVTAHGLGILLPDKTGKEANRPLIPRNARVPAEARKVFKTSRPGQQRMSVQVVEGDQPDPQACHPVGKYRITDLPADLPANSPVEVTCAIDADGRVDVTAEDKTSAKEVTVTLERQGGLDKKQLAANVKLMQELTLA
jgi:molecular chaperone DnaK